MDVLVSLTPSLTSVSSSAGIVLVSRDSGSPMGIVAESQDRDDWKTSPQHLDPRDVCSWMSAACSAINRVFFFGIPSSQLTILGYSHGLWLEDL